MSETTTNSNWWIWKVFWILLALTTFEVLLGIFKVNDGLPDFLVNETFVNNQKDFPVYTRPEVYKEHKVPDVLLSGNHKEIDNWKKNNLKDM